MNSLFNLNSPNTPLLSSSSSSSSVSPRQPQPPLRIADILLAGDDDDDVLDDNSLMGGSREDLKSIDCSSPRRIVARWLSGLRRLKVKRIAGESVKREKEREEEKGLGDVIVQERCSMNGLNGGVSGTSASESGLCRTDNSFNLGVGCCLLYLIAASKNELNKMMEMRMQMETLFQNTRNELFKKSELSKQSEPNDIFAYSVADAPEGTDCETQILPEFSTFTIYDESLKCETPEKEGCLEEGMNQLEAELEVELERLQLHLDREKLMKHPEQLRVEVTDEHTAYSRSQTISSGEVIDPQPQEASMDCGVPPDELERRLHELLEARQQEQIRELEAALEHLKHKLHKKEMEVSWWKDTAMLISQHAIEPSQFTSQHDPKFITSQVQHQMYDSF